LVGDEQAEHVGLVGASLYQALIQRAVCKANVNRECGPPPQPEIERGCLPQTYIPDAALRISL